MLVASFGASKFLLERPWGIFKIHFHFRRVQTAVNYQYTAHLLSGPQTFVLSSVQLTDPSGDEVSRVSY